MEDNLQPTNVPANNPQPTSPEPKRSSNLKGVLIILAVLEVVTILTAGYFAYQFTQLKKQVSNSQPAPAPISNPVSPTTNPTTDWKTYKNTKFNFSFKYPSELTYIYDQSDKYIENGISNAMILVQNFDGSKPRTETDNDFQIVVYISNKAGQFNLEDPQGEQTKTTINGVEVIKSFTTQKWVLVPTVFFQSSPNKVAFQLSNPKSTNKAWFDQIVSTFQVTN